MPTISVRIPQMGEGLQEARLVEYLKRPGDRVRRDEPIYVMETDKAVTEVESPFAGTLIEWLVEADSVLPIGTEIARMEVDAATAGEVSTDSHGTHAGAATLGTDAIDESSVADEAPVASQSRLAVSAGPATVRLTPHLTGNLGVPIPPRTRKYLRECGLIDAIARIPALGKKLLPADVDRYLSAMSEADSVGTRAANGARPNSDTLAPTASVPAGASIPEASFAGATLPGANDSFTEATLSKTQQTLNYRMYRGMQACIPAVIEVDVDWTRLVTAREALRQEYNATGFALTLWCVAQTMRNFPLLRSSLAADGKTLRTYRHVNLGVAVAVENGLLRTAVIRHADNLSLPIFIPTLQTQVEKVRLGEDQIDATTTVMVSNIGSAGVRAGIPVIVTPAVATIAVGRVGWTPVPLPQGGIGFQQSANLTMTFDHRIVNGVGAAEFLVAVKESMERFTVPSAANLSAAGD